MKLEETLNKLDGSELEKIFIYNSHRICLFKGTILQLRNKSDLMDKILIDDLYFVVGKGYEGVVL